METKPEGPRILVDADACPVKEEVKRAARTANVPAVFVSSYDHMLREQSGVQIVRVDPGKESADLYIVNHTKAGDVVVTQDYGLAALVLAKKAFALSERGAVYDAGNIEFLLDRRHISAKVRRGGGRTKGPRKFTAEDRAVFSEKLLKLLHDLQEKS
ncbi:YaiI/YqxD family protein [Saccharibacillus sp. CPCC 101409]|uniref:YaiI/YqxD family protein n=1 Tax=Saccharibacillus sp. CPCC 101409 TaxID=3058041 RepID=UPI002672F7B4|nr:YaiI/YqxD family protein [Saccharibacillus sp. CPCC 101409]MDO3409179.1 YaiI/YqxD family protein [Saccharibacillus sp. CPCC 101409]